MNAYEQNRARAIVLLVRINEDQTADGGTGALVQALSETTRSVRRLFTYMTDGQSLTSNLTKSTVHLQAYSTPIGIVELGMAVDEMINAEGEAP